MVINCPCCGFVGKLRTDSPPVKPFALCCVKCKEKFAVKLNSRSVYRKEVSIFVTYTIYHCEDREKRKIKTGKALDISEGGLRLAIEKRMVTEGYEVVGNAMAMTLALPPKKDKLEMTGKIVRIIESTDFLFSMGVRFTDMSHYVKKELGFFMMA